MEKLRHALKDQRALVEDIRVISGAPGLAYGVIHHGRIMCERYLGHRDVQRKLAIDRDTLSLVASLSKAMSATMVAKLVEDGKLDGIARCTSYYLS